MRVNEARRHDQSGSVDFLVPMSVNLANGDNAAAIDGGIRDKWRPSGPVGDRSATQDDVVVLFHEPYPLHVFSCCVEQSTLFGAGARPGGVPEPAQAFFEHICV